MVTVFDNNKEKYTMRTVKVITNYNGLRGDYVETITRKSKSIGNTRKGEQKREAVSYKGKYYTVFRLPESYGEIAGFVIRID